MTTETREMIVKQAALDAQGHQEEFPGQRIAGDWDSEAYQLAFSELGLDEDDRDAGWEVYSKALHSAVNAMVGA